MPTEQDKKYAIERVEFFARNWRHQRSNQQIASVPDSMDSCSALDVVDLEAFITDRAHLVERLEQAHNALRQARPDLAMWNMDTSYIDDALAGADVPDIVQCPNCFIMIDPRQSIQQATSAGSVPESMGLLRCLQYVECVYRLNFVAEGEPSSTLKYMQDVLTANAQAPNVPDGTRIDLPVSIEHARAMAHVATVYLKQHDAAPSTTASCKPGGCSAIGCEGGHYCFDENGIARPKADPNAVARAIFPYLAGDAQADEPDAIEALFYTACNNTLAEFKKRVLAANAKAASALTAEQIARVMWEIRREDEDRCDMELEDLGDDHAVWKEAQAVVDLLKTNSGAKHA